MNKLLDRQLRRLYGDVNTVPQELVPLVTVVNDTYQGFDQDRELTLRSLDLSSKELLEANQRIRAESQRQQAILAALRSATTALRPTEHDNSETWLDSTEDAVSLTNSLTELIEQQKQHGQKLEESKTHTENEKAKVEAILHSIGDGIFAVDLNCRVIMMNSVAENFTGYSFAEAKDKHYRDIFRFIHEDRLQEEYPFFIEEVIKTGTTKALSQHTLLVKKDQTQLPVSESAAPIKTADGEIFGCIVVIHDVSIERKFEQEKNDFVSIAAHQLRTPLGIIRWTLEMLMQDAQLNETTRNKVDKAYDSNQRLISLVNGLLNVSKIDQGKIQDEPTPTNIGEVIVAIVAELELLAQQRNISIEVQLPNEGVSNILIDPNRLREALQNVVSNAIKYNVSGGKTIITVAQTDQSIVVAISDQGIGIPEEDRQRIFSKFYRAKNAAHNDTTGSGLGLFVVKSYLEAWGGKISFQSVEGKGSTFTIELPLNIEPQKNN